MINTYSTKYILLIIFLSIINFSCAAHIKVRPSTPADLNNNIGLDRNISLFVGDHRQNKSVFQTEAKSTGLIYYSPVEIIWYSYENALNSCGFKINSPASFIYKVILKKYYVAWPIGYKIPVTAEIKVIVEIQNQDGDYLFRKEFSHEEEQEAFGGGVVSDIPNDLLQKCLDNVIINSMTDSSIIKVF